MAVGSWSQVKGASRVLAWRMPLSWYRRLTLANAVAVWMLIVLGGLVRVTGSGMGCGGSWPMCHGHWLPSPTDYHEMIEWNHRLFATMVGFLMVATVGSTLLWFRSRRRLFWLAILATVTYIGQAILGGVTVLLHLDQTWVAAHMGNSMLLLASVILLAQFARIGQVRGASGDRKLLWLTLATLAWTYASMFTGSAVVGAKADVACPAWPQCGPSSLLPVTWDQWVNFGHRLAVGLADVLMLVLTVAIWKTRRGDRRLMLSAHALALVYVAQVFLGAFTIWLRAPEALKGAHLALAAASWGALVVMTVFVWAERPRPGPPGRGDGVEEPRAAAGSRRQEEGLPALVRTYIGLTRPGVIPLLLVPTVASMLIAAVQQPPSRPLLELILWTVIGGTLATAGAHSINQYLDRDIDARMKRTRRRALVTGRVLPEHALWFGIALTIAGCAELWVAVNPLSSLLALAGNLFYVFVYTMWLKRTTVQNVVIGGAAGAVPPLVGWAAVTGGVGLPALLFFAIIFFWTPAHFWALALVRSEEYRGAGVPMLPAVKGARATHRGIVIYAALTLASTLVPVLTHSLGVVYLAVALVLGSVFVFRAVRLGRDGSLKLAWGLFKYSNTYLAVLYLAMVVDRLLAMRALS